MKFSTTAIILASISSVSAFAPSTHGSAQSTTALNAEQQSRSQFLSTAFTTSAATLLTLTSAPKQASAAKYGSFGAGSPEVLDPKDKIVDDEILASEPVQKSITAVKEYKNTVSTLQETLKSNPQADIGPIIRSKFDFGALRTDLNTLNTAFDEETQRGTDRVIRLILQDITELETANRQKPGVERSEKRLDIMKGKLDKLNVAFSDYLAFV
jgi:hypothetical protein